MQDSLKLKQTHDPPLYLPVSTSAFTIAGRDDRFVHVPEEDAVPFPDDDAFKVPDDDMESLIQGAELTAQQQQQVLELLEKHRDAFYWSPDQLGVCTIGGCFSIDTQDHPAITYI